MEENYVLTNIHSAVRNWTLIQYLLTVKTRYNTVFLLVI